MKLNVGHVGFGTAILAGLILAIIGHPEPTMSIATSGPAPAPASPNAPRTFVLRSVSVDLPSNDVAFPGANAQAVNDSCLACHSAGMVLTQPSLSKATWGDIVEKMIHVYRAPIDQAQAGAIIDYLQAAKGHEVER